ncbi:MAG: helix-turn-helix domain-containing protein [Oscillospiraceae bacterium]|nr:helix-turn-helix domain-containing protein [Oscillospiraceae bacterium]
MNNEYNTVVTSDRIKARAKEIGMTVTQLNSLCGLSENTIKNAGKSIEGMKARNLFMIAEILNCSVDYLLGRTDEPTAKVNNNIITTGNVITAGDISPVASGENSTSNGIIIDSKAPAKDVAELVDLIQSLPLVKRAEAIVYMNNLKNEE